MNQGSRVIGLAAVCVALLGARSAAATPPGCGDLVIDDPLLGATVGDQQGGAIDPAGFTPGGTDPPGSIVWALDPPIHQGCFEVTVSGVTTAGVGEHDLIELFTGPDGSFTDGATDHFLLLKIAGDVFPDYEGQLKIEMGLEYDTFEVGSWANSVPWDPAQSYTLTVRLDGAGLAEFYRDDVLLEAVDYSMVMGGELHFASLRIPNDGEYQVEPPLSGIYLTDVHVFDADPQAGDDTTGGGGGDSTGDSQDDGTGPAGDSGGSAGGSTGDGGSTGSGATGGIDPGTGFPLPPQGPDDNAGCTCRSPGTPRPPSLSLGLLLLLFCRRSRP